MNFRDKIRKPNQEEPIKQNNLNKASSNKNLYRDITNQLSSQQFDPGAFRRTQGVGQIGKRNSSRIQQSEYQEEIQPQQNYYTQRGSHHPQSLLNSNAAENYNGSLFESKLHQTKGELNEQMFQLQKRIKKQIEKDRGFIEDYIGKMLKKQVSKLKEQQNNNLIGVVNQVNQSLLSHSQKQKTFITQCQQKMQSIQKQFGDFNIEIQQKIEKLMNSNSNIQIASSIKKSLNKNPVNGDYAVELKSSIKDIPIVNNTLVEQIKCQIHDTQEAIRMLKFQMSNLREEMKSKLMAPSPLEKEKPEMIDASKISYLTEEINGLKFQLQNIQINSDSKLKQFRGILEVQEQNLAGMNDTLAKVINTQLLPRLKKVQDLQQPQMLQKQADYIKKQVIKELQSMPIIRVRSTTVEEKQKLARMRTLPKSQQQSYLLDQNNYILDCFGNYLLDQTNQRIRLQEEQVYYLQQMEGVQISLPVEAK